MCRLTLFMMLAMSPVLGGLEDSSLQPVYNRWLEEYKASRQWLIADLKARGVQDPEQVYGDLGNQLLQFNQHFPRSQKPPSVLAMYTAFFTQDTSRIETSRRLARMVLLEKFLPDILVENPPLETVEGMLKQLEGLPQGSGLRAKLIEHHRTRTTDPEKYYWKADEALRSSNRTTPVTQEDYVEILSRFIKNMGDHKQARMKFEGLVQRFAEGQNMPEILAKVAAQLAQDPEAAVKRDAFIKGFKADDPKKSIFLNTRKNLITPFVKALETEAIKCGLDQIKKGA